jgi:hypothetical protein
MNLEDGFSGYVSFTELRASGVSAVTPRAGIYIVVRRSTEKPTFLVESCGGRFKDREPAVACELLAATWIPEAPIIYVGKAGSLLVRLTAYADFGVGKRVGHWGGRYIWQLADRDELLVAWKECPAGETPETADAELVRDFKRAHDGRRPFANIADPSRRLKSA